MGNCNILQQKILQLAQISLLIKAQPLATHKRNPQARAAAKEGG